MMLLLRYAKSNVKDGRGRAVQLLNLVGLSDRVRHRPNQLSGGEQQQVAIARALVNLPALALMRLLNREEGVTFVIVTHDLELAAQTDRMIRLRDSRVVGDHAVDRAQSPALAS